MKAGFFAVAAGLVLAGLAAPGSQAAPMLPSQGMLAASTNDVIEVATVVKKKTVVTPYGKVKKKTVVYNPGYHGPRYRAVRPGYSYYYGGYYYRSPWWRVPGAVIVVRP